MFIVDCLKAKPTITQTEPLITSGSENAFRVHFIFNEDWDEMTKFAAFRVKGKPVMEVLLDDTDTCEIPWELLVNYGPKVQVGAYGIKILDDKQIRLPTIWVNVNDISEGVISGVAGQDPSPDVLDQLVTALQTIPRPMTVPELRALLGKEIEIP